MTSNGHDVPILVETTKEGEKKKGGGRGIFFPPLVQERKTEILPFYLGLDGAEIYLPHWG